MRSIAATKILLRIHQDLLDGTVRTPLVCTIDTDWVVLGVLVTALILRHWLGKGRTENLS
jgi:hypothetical protein